jgi:hypothetical protein
MRRAKPRGMVEPLPGSMIFARSEAAVWRRRTWSSGGPVWPLDPAAARRWQLPQPIRANTARPARASPGTAASAAGAGRIGPWGRHRRGGPDRHRRERVGLREAVVDRVAPRSADGNTTSTV